MRKRVILNATTLAQGGSLQACVSFIQMSQIYENNIDWIYMISPEVKEEIDSCVKINSKRNEKIYSPSPSRNSTTRKKLYQDIHALNPDAVFTFFGPAYIRIGVPHLMGVGDGWVTHSNKLAFSSIEKNSEKVITVLRSIYKGWWYRSASRWVVEAAYAKHGLIKRLGIDEENIYIVPNTCDSRYNNSHDMDFHLPQIKDNRILTLSTYYSHKNLEIIPYVAYELKKMLKNDIFMFVITVPNEKEEVKKILKTATELGVRQNIVNIGYVALKDGPALYKSVDLVFMPSLLETFSAVYPEAMASRRPIVTSDLDFARDICRDAALYYPAIDPYSAAVEINKLFTDRELWLSMVEKGTMRMKQFPSAEDKYKLYEKIILEMLE